MIDTFADLITMARAMGVVSTDKPRLRGNMLVFLRVDGEEDTRIVWTVNQSILEGDKS